MSELKTPYDKQTENRAAIVLISSYVLMAAYKP
jgi:hypothetical protein